MKNWIIQLKKIETWGHFYLIPTIVVGYTTKVNGYYSVEMGWGRWFLSIDVIPKTY